MAVRPAAGRGRETDPRERHPFEGGAPRHPVGRDVGVRAETRSVAPAWTFLNPQPTKSVPPPLKDGFRRAAIASRAAARTRRFGSSRAAFSRSGSAPRVAQERERLQRADHRASPPDPRSASPGAPSASRSIIERRTSSARGVAERRERDRRVPAHVGDGIAEKDLEPRRAARSLKLAEDVGRHLAHPGVLGKRTPR